MKKQIKKGKSSSKNRKIKKKPQDVDATKVDQKKSKSKSKQKLKDVKPISKPKQKKNSKKSKSLTKDKIIDQKSRSKSKGEIQQQKKSSQTKDKDQPIDSINKQNLKDKQMLNKTKSLKVLQKYRTKSIIEELQNYSCELTSQKKYKIKMHGSYQIDEKHKLYKKIETLFKLFIEKQKKKTEGIFIKTRYSFFPVFQFLLSAENQGQHKCCICQFQFEQPRQTQEMEALLLDIHNEDVVALKCSHLLHLQCLKMLIGEKQWFKCPVCSMIYGKMIGDQPPGTMTSTVSEFMKCDGYPDVGTIVIHYSMHSGKRGDISFPGTGRTAYLPNNIEGNQVLGLLKEAFNRKLIFTVGRSVTTGRDNQVVWNGIHHKTNLNGGSAYFGYPDPTYFDRVKLELAAKGVF